MLAPLENRSVRQREEGEAEEIHGSLVALRRERDFDLRTSVRRIAALSDEVARLRALCEEQRQQIVAYASGEAIVSLGRRLMALSAANDGLREAAERARTLQALLDATRDEYRRLAAERDTLAAALAAAAPGSGDGREVPR